jgi:hypothetical protein
MNFPRPPPNSYSSANFKQTIKHPPDSTYTNQPSPFTILKNFVSMPNFVPPTVTTDRKETRSASSYGSGMPNYDGESNINDDSFDDALMEFDLEGSFIYAYLLLLSTPFINHGKLYTAYTYIY